MADGGVWRTVSGRRIFIKDGQDLTSAMKESGKFRELSLPKTTSGKYTYEVVDNPDSIGFWDKKNFNVYDENGKLTYQKGISSEKEVEMARNQFEVSEDGQAKGWLRDNKQKLKLDKNSKIGNYRNTKQGKELFEKGTQIKDATEGAIKNIKIDKSNVSNSKYITLQVDTNKFPSLNDEYVIRISDHKRPSYFSNGSFGGYDHHYDFDVVLEKGQSVNWDYVISSAIEEINNNK